MEFSFPERSLGLTVSTIMLVIAGLILFMVTPIIGAYFWEEFLSSVYTDESIRLGRLLGEKPRI